jgi:hypothetical protein
MAGFSSGSVLFAGPGGSISQNNASFFWDNVNGRLGINNSSPSERLEVNGVIRAWTSVQLGQFGSGVLNASSFSKSSTGSDFFSFDNASGYTPVNGTYYFLRLNNNISPTSGIAVINQFLIQGTINQTGGANGITRGIYVNPTITAAADFRAIEWSTNAATSPSASWGLYGSGSAPNYLSGSLGIGIAPSTPLHVNGIGTFIHNTGYNSTTTDGAIVLYNPLISAYAAIGVTSDTYLRIKSPRVGFVSSASGTQAWILGSYIYSFNSTAGLRLGTAVETTTIANNNSIYVADSVTITNLGHSYNMLRLTSTISSSVNPGLSRGLYISPTIIGNTEFRAIQWDNNVSVTPSTSASWGLYGVGSAPNYLSGSLSIGPATNEALSFQYAQDNTLGGSFASRIVSLASGVAYRDLFLVSRAVLFQQQGYINSFYISPNGNTVLNSLTDDGVNRLQVSGSAKITDNLVVTGSATILSNLTAIGGNVSLASVGGSVTFINGYNNQIVANRIHLYSTPTNIRGINAGNQGWILSKSTGATDLYPSSIFAIDSTNQGFLVPRMSVTQRTAITNPNQGLLVYDTSSATEGLWMYNSGSNPGWQEVLTNSGSQSISGSITATSFTGSLFGTSSWAVNVLSSSYSQTSSYLNPLNQTVVITGSLNISGSTTQIGGNNLLGNTRLSGSIIISGSLGTNNPTVQIYGDTQHNGYIRFDPVSTNIDTSISASYIYVSGSTNDLYFSQNGSGYNNVTRLRWLEGNLYTGLLHGGLITTQSSTVYQVASGSGIIVTMNATIAQDPYPTIQFLQWPNLSASIAPYSQSYDQQFVAILSNGTIGAQGTPYNDGDFNTKIPIGVVVHQNHSTINAVQTFPSTGYGWKQRSSDFIRAFGPLKITGYILSPSGSSTRGLVLSGGTAFVEGRNYTIDPSNPSYIVEASGIATSKIYRYRQSGSDWAYDTNGGLGYTSIDPTQYSNNGVLTPVGTNDWSIQRVYYFPNSGTKALYVYYGNDTYSSQADALAAVATETFTEAPNTAANAIYIGYMLVRHNADFTTPASYAIYEAGLFRGVGTGGAGGGGGGATTLASLTDVNISGVSNLQPLAYDSVSTKWINTSVISASISGNANTATTALTASSADNFTVRGTLTAQTIVAQTITSSILYSSGSNIFGNSLSNTQQFTGSVRITGSLSLPYLTTGSILFVGADRSVSQNNSSLFWDSANGRLGIGTNAPAYKLDITGNVRVSSGGTNINGLLQFFGVTGNFYHDIQGGDYAGHPDVTRIRLGNSGTHWQGVMSFWTKDANTTTITERMRINQLGSIGIGTTSPTALLHVSGTTGGLFEIDSNTLANILYVSSSGNVGIGTNTPAYALVVNGQGEFTNLLRTTGGIFCDSNTARFRHVTVGVNQGAGTGFIQPEDGTQSIGIRTGASFGGTTRLLVTSTGNVLINSTTDDTVNRLQVTGTARITQALTASAALISGSGTQRLTVVGSGSAQPLFTVQGSQGELFSIVDSLSGSLFSVNDQSGLPIMEVFSDNTTLVGNYLAPMLLTTARTSSAAGINTLYRLPTSSYDAVYIDYTIRSGSNARAGNFMAMWSGTSVNFTDNSITEFGTTSGFVFGAHISGSNMVVTGSSSTAGWTVKTIIKAI